MPFADGGAFAAEVTGRSLKALRTTLITVGVLAILAGLAILIWPVKAFEVVTFVFAVYAIVAAVAYGVIGATAKGLTGGARALNIVLAVVYLVAGIVIFANMAAATTVFAWVIGITTGVMWLIEGIATLAASGRSHARGWTIAYGVLGVLAGITLILSPLTGTLFLWIFLGASLLVLGITNVWRGVQAGKAAEAVDGGAGPSAG